MAKGSRTPAQRTECVCVCVNDIYTKVALNDNYHNDDDVHSCVWNGSLRVFLTFIEIIEANSG